ncbi:MAG: 30S ribosome-binding factor RbfA [Limisphaerales bacterium]
MRAVRHERVRELLKRELGEILRREMPLAETGLVSVNSIELSDDLQHAVIFVSILGNAEQTKAAARVLERDAVRFQNLVGRSVVLRYTPRLRFVPDDSIERGNRVLKILEALPPPAPTP